MVAVAGVVWEHDPDDSQHDRHNIRGMMGWWDGGRVCDPECSHDSPAITPGPSAGMLPDAFSSRVSLIFFMTISEVRWKSG